MTADSGGRPQSRGAVIATAAVFLSFCLNSFLRFPVPGPNEPHYLCKARHYWNPAWCADDLFLSSSNAHLVFYQTFGLLTRFFSLETSAVIGRIIGLLILAVGWAGLVRSLVHGRWSPVWAAWAFLALAALGNLSGEWLVGGIESKVIAYGLLFAALALWLNRTADARWRLVAIGALVGTAISFHPVVGIWGLAAGLFAVGMTRLLHGDTANSKRPLQARWMAVAAIVAVMAAAPGLIAGARAAAGSSVEADYIQVYYRLAHHLDPWHFAVDAEHFWNSPWLGYAVLAAVLLIGRHGLVRNERETWFFWLVIGSALIALCGLIVGWRTGPPEQMLWYPLRWKLLKLYPFRLVDALLPIAVGITAAALAELWTRKAHPPAAVMAGWNRRVPLVWAIFAIPPLIATAHVAPDARPPLTTTEMADWLDACRWIEKNTPPNALVLTPTQESWAFKWFAQRAEFASHKDCPQDGPGIVAWNERLLFIGDWSLKHMDGFSTAVTRPLYTQHGITHILTMGLGPFDFEPIYRNRTFRLYRIDDLPPKGNVER